MIFKRLQLATVNLFNSTKYWFKLDFLVKKEYFSHPINYCNPFDLNNL